MPVFSSIFLQGQGAPPLEDLVYSIDDNAPPSSDYITPIATERFSDAIMKKMGMNQRTAESLTNSPHADALQRFILDNPHGMTIGSGFRDANEQAGMIAKRLRERNTKENADAFTSDVRTLGAVEAGRQWETYLRNNNILNNPPLLPPGKSNHGNATAWDLNYGSNPAASKKWASENAAAYGFHFPVRGEDWHLEPINKDTAPPNQSQYASAKSSTADETKPALDFYGRPITKDEAPSDTASAATKPPAPLLDDVYAKRAEDAAREAAYASGLGSFLMRLM